LRAGIAIILALLLGSCAPTPSTLEQILAAGELRVVTRNSPTTFYVGGADELRGAEYELARGFAEWLGVELRIYSADQFWTLFPEVGEGRAHIAAAGLQVTEPRLDLVSFGPGYQHVRQLVVYRMGADRPGTLADLVGGRLEVVYGSSPIAALTQAQLDVPALAWTEQRTGNVETLIRHVVAGDADYAIVPSNEFAILRHYYPEARVAFELGTGETIAWALPRMATDLREAVSSYFAELTATGGLEVILARNSHSGHEFDFVGSRAFVRHLHQRFPRYQEYFQLAAAETGLDWRLLAAIAYQESHWNERAVSPTGVRGVMMLTEHTAEIVGVGERSDPWESILGGSRYLRRVLDKFPERIPADDRLWLAIAAYNIGFGHVEDARVITEIQGGNPDRWDDVKQRLPLLADESWYSRVRRGYAPGTVPVDYVDNVQRYFALLEWMQGTELLTSVSEQEPQTPAETNASS